MKLAVNMSMRVVALVLECRMEGRIKHVTTRQVFFMTGQVDYLEGLGRVIKISRYEILLPCNKTHYHL